MIASLEIEIVIAMDELAALMGDFYDDDDDDQGEKQQKPGREGKASKASKKRKQPAESQSAASPERLVLTSPLLDARTPDGELDALWRTCLARQQAQQQRPFPAREVWLAKALRKLHYALELACERHAGRAVMAKLELKSSATIRNGDSLFEQWHFSALARSTDAGRVGPLPDAAGLAAAQPVLERALAKHASDAVAALVAEAFTQKAVKSVASLKPPTDSTERRSGSGLRISRVAPKLKLKKKHRPEPKPEPNSKDKKKQKKGDKTSARANGGIVSIACGSAELSLSEAHFDKLRALHELNRPWSDAGSSDAGSSAAGSGSSVEAVSDEAVAADVFSALQRYTGIGGAGFQAALTPAVFDVLASRMGVRAECFASPLNCRFPLFCSAFPDTDACFGSLGSFFEFRPAHGSFQANPPFVDSVVSAMAAHMAALLRDARESGAALSFAIVVPARFRDLLLRRLKRFHRALVTFDNRQHWYMPGHQQTKAQAEPKAEPKAAPKADVETARTSSAAVSKHPRVAATSDSDLHVVQTKAGAEKWPFGDDLRDLLQAAFANTGSYPTGLRL